MRIILREVVRDQRQRRQKRELDFEKNEEARVREIRKESKCAKRRKIKNH